MYNFLVLRRCLNDENKSMYVRDLTAAQRIFTDWIKLDAMWVSIIELTDDGPIVRVIKGGNNEA